MLSNLEIERLAALVAPQGRGPLRLADPWCEDGLTVAACKTAIEQRTGVPVIAYAAGDKSTLAEEASALEVIDHVVGRAAQSLAVTLQIPRTLRLQEQVLQRRRESWQLPRDGERLGQSDNYGYSHNRFPLTLPAASYQHPPPCQRGHRPPRSGTPHLRPTAGDGRSEAAPRPRTTRPAAPTVAPARSRSRRRRPTSWRSHLVFFVCLRG